MSLTNEVDESIDQIETEESESDDGADDEISEDTNESDDDEFEDDEVEAVETNLQDVVVNREEATPAAPIARAPFLTKLNQKVGFTNLISALSERFIDQANQADRYLEEKNRKCFE